MRGTRVRTALAVVGMASAMLLTACGGASSTAAGAPAKSSAASTGNGMDKLTATEIVAQMQAAAGAATSVHVAGKSGTTSIDLKLGGSAADGLVGLGGGQVEIVRIGEQLYLKANKAFWTTSTSARVAAVVAGKYVKIAGTQASQYALFTKMSEFFGQALKPSGPVTKGAVSTIDGQRAIALTDSSDGSVLYVALDGPPLPIKTTNTGTDAGEVDFSGWNQTVTVAAPPASQILDLATLPGA
jgi:hypothetical protein